MKTYMVMDSRAFNDIDSSIVLECVGDYEDYNKALVEADEWHNTDAVLVEFDISKENMAINPVLIYDFMKAECLV